MSPLFVKILYVLSVGVICTIAILLSGRFNQKTDLRVRQAIAGGILGLAVCSIVSYLSFDLMPVNLPLRWAITFSYMIFGSAFLAWVGYHSKTE